MCKKQDKHYEVEPIRVTNTAPEVPQY